MALRWLTEEEIEFLAPLFRNEGMSVPDPKTSRVLAEVQGRKVIGMIGVQLFPQVGPLWIHPEYRDPTLAISLASSMRKELEASSLDGYMVIAEHEFSAKFCELAHLRKVETPVYIKDREKST